MQLSYSMREQFARYHARTQRWAVLVCHRRSGKTTATVNDLILKACRPGRPDARYAFIAPYFSQAKDIAWGFVKKYSEPLWSGEPNETELRVDFINGARIRLYGADNPDRLRGLGFDGVVCDEFADWRSGVWDEVVRPTLLDRQGFATFIGTPKGKNEFYETYQRAKEDDRWFRMLLKGSDSNLIPLEEMEHLKATMDSDAYNQEIECSFEASLKGSYYSEEMERGYREGRIGRVPVERTSKVHTAWDLGYSDSTAIWFIQAIGKERRLVDYYEASGVGFDHYAKVLNEKGYVYGDHYFPFDVQAKMLGMDQDRITTLKRLGIEVSVVPQGNIQDGINAVRSLLGAAWIDEARCEKGIECLKAYRKTWDDRKKVWADKPLHDWASHGADALRTFATGFINKHNIEPNYNRNYRPSPLGWQGA